MAEKDLKYLNLLSKSFPSVPAAAAEIVRLSAVLELPKITEHFMSDIHGEYTYFTHILKNASGAARRKIDDSFGDLLSDEEKNQLALLLYYPERELGAREHSVNWYRVTIHRLISVCRVATDKYSRAKVRTRMPEEYAYIIEELTGTDEHEASKRKYFESLINNIIDTGIADQFIIAISNLISRLTVDRLHICGDIFDRGPAAHQVLDDLMDRTGVDFVWGNHDALWMGAAMGNPACVANALRNSLKYGNFDTLEDGYGINVRPLVLFALEQYADDTCPAFQPRRVSDMQMVDDDGGMTAKTLKAISIIAFKLEGQLIRRHPDYGMENRLLLGKIRRENGAVTVEVDGKVWPMMDVRLPTVDPEDPYRLSEREQQVIDQLVLSFRRSDHLQEHLRYLLDKGAMYRTCNGNLLYHGCVPMEPDGSFTEVDVDGKLCCGRGLMDALDRKVRSAMYDRRDENTDLMWYLWCGPASPLNGKNRIATFERTFITDPAAGEEEKNPYYTLWNNVETAEKILADFGLNPKRGHIINGHVPVKKSKGDVPIKADGKFINIDGGLAKSYQPETGIAGYTLVFNSHVMYLAEHQPFNPDTAARKDVDMISRIIMIDQYSDRLTVKDTDGGKDVEERIADLRQLLEAYRSGLIRPPIRMDT